MMAFAGHSPTRTYPGPGSPVRALNGYPESQSTTSLYGHPRSMLPPSPQHYQPRFPATTLPTPSPSVPPPQYDGRTNKISHKRPKSSMSISSMLGGEPDRAQHDSRSVLHTRTPSQPAPITAPFPGHANQFMSPTQYSTKSGYHEFPSKQRSRTPDKLVTSFIGGGVTRQRSSSSGMAMQRPGTYEEPHDRSTASTPAVALHDPFVTNGDGRTGGYPYDDRMRRTSLSGVLHQSSNRPQNTSTIPQGYEMYQPQPPAHSSNMYDRNPPPPPPPPDAPKQNGFSSLYDTKPPGMNGISRPPIADLHSPLKISTNSVSPDLRRSSLTGLQGRGFAGILNGPTSQPAEPQSATSQRMMRQDSAQSQSSAFGERTKFRAYSPFNSSFTSNPDDPGRKGSDELSHHRAIIGLAQENKRGRYSPLPQAVQGAQAQSPVPDATARSDRGRVFSGIGGGISTTPTPGAMPSSPFKKDEAPLKLSEDNLKTLSRGGNKRSRKNQQDENRDDTGTGTAEKPTGRKRGKHQHNYKADLEEMAQAGFPPRNASMTGLHTNPRSSTPTNLTGQAGAYYQPRPAEPLPVLKSRKVIHVASVFDAASKKSRRHLGNFTYRPRITQAELTNPSALKFDVLIEPNLLPSFADPENVNCTYTIHVPRTWLQQRERCLITGARHVWGSGIYTDDSDPVAAAMHSGFLKAGFADSVDTNLLGKIVHDQNPKVQFPKSINIPAEPMVVVENKDLKLTMVVLPTLEKYEGSNRFGVRSRTWPEVGTKTPHDGVSFGVLEVEFVDMGTEEKKMGRTGHERRERRRLELESRSQALAVRRQRIEAVKNKRADLLRKRVSEKAGTRPAMIPKSVP